MLFNNFSYFFKKSTAKIIFGFFMVMTLGGIVFGAPIEDGFMLRVGFISATNKVQLGPEGWALQKGILAKELQKVGVIEIKTIGFPNGPDVNEAIAAGELDLGLFGDTPAIIGRAAGLKTKLIGFNSVGQNVWMVAKKNGPRTLNDLKGQTVATSKGSYMHRYLLGLLKEIGLYDKVTVIHLLPRDAEAALTRGDIAAYAAPTGTGPQLVSNGFPVIDEAVKHPKFLGTSVTLAPESFLVKHSEIIVKWNEVRKIALADIKAHPDDYYRFATEVTGYDRNVVLQSYNINLYYPEPFPAKGIELLKGTKEFLNEQNLLKENFKLHDWFYRKSE